MKLGQTSIVDFVSRFSASVLGFVATIYFARLLGAEPLGVYYLVLGLVSWLAIGGEVGVSEALTKRISEGDEREEFATAGAVLVGALFATLSVGILVFRAPVNEYVGYPAAGFVVLILLVNLANSVVVSLLEGVHLVHISGLLAPVRIGARSLLQIAALLAALQLTGLFLGYVMGSVLVILIGSVFVYRRFDHASLPSKRHFKRIFDYAKFSWLGNLQSRMFNYTDVLVLGLFVSSSLVGIYSIAWNIAQFLILFAGAISTTLFPEMSKVSTDRGSEAVSGLLEDALSYAGLLLIPGLVGGFILGERILRIYGPEFTDGATILTILIVANLVMSYQNQLLNTLNAIDRPDLSFRVNALFVVANVALNLALIYLYGWIGAAVATVLSATVSLCLAYYYTNSILDFELPRLEITYQAASALVMGVIVYGGLWIEETYRLLEHNFATVVVLVALGAGVYFATMFALSSTFRTTVVDNLPFALPASLN